MKKTVFTIMAGIFICTSLSAQSVETFKPPSWLSLGAGLTMLGAFENGLTGSYIRDDERRTNVDMTMLMLDVGLTTFVDLKYVEFLIGASVFTYMLYRDQNIWQYNSFDMATFGKYPIKLPGNKVTFYPMLGATYKIVYSMKTITGNSRADAPLDFNMLWFNAGLGIDRDWFGNFYTKTQFIYGIRLPTKFENDFKKRIENYPSGEAENKFNQGFSYQIMLGYRL
jgi:hypothetical protein